LISAIKTASARKKPLKTTSARILSEIYSNVNAKLFLKALEEYFWFEREKISPKVILSGLTLFSN